MQAIRTASFVIARFLLSAIFLTESINKIFHWHETEQILMTVLGDWQSHWSSSEFAQMVLSSALVFTPLLLLTATLLELVGSLLLLLGVKEKLGAAFLIIMLIPTTILFHQFWFVDSSAEKVLQQVMFLKNLAIIGGLLLVLLHGAQPPQKKHGSPS